MSTLPIPTDSAPEEMSLRDLIRSFPGWEAECLPYIGDPADYSFGGIIRRERPDIVARHCESGWRCLVERKQAAWEIPKQSRHGLILEPGQLWAATVGRTLPETDIPDTSYRRYRHLPVAYVVSGQERTWACWAEVVQQDLLREAAPAMPILWRSRYGIVYLEQQMANAERAWPGCPVRVRDTWYGTDLGFLLSQQSIKSWLDIRSLLFGTVTHC